jgi:uncharacterized coiled-coil protein SlyX
MPITPVSETTTGGRSGFSWTWSKNDKENNIMEQPYTKFREKFMRAACSPTPYEALVHFEKIAGMCGKIYGMDLFKKEPFACMMDWKKASEEFRKSYKDYLALMGLVPMEEYVALSEKYKSMGQQIKERKKKIDDQEKEIAEQKKTIDDLGKKIATNIINIADLENNIAGHKKTITDLKKNIDSQKTSIAEGNNQ